MDLDKIRFDVSTLKRIGALLALSLLILVGLEIYDLGLGSGHWLGRFSLKWALAFAAYILFATVLFALLILALYAPRRLTRVQNRLLLFRSGFLRWPIILAAALFPAYFVFYSPWGGLFSSLFTRLLIFILSILLLSFLLTKEEEKLISLKALLLSALFIGSFLALAESFVLVSDYPFSLHWSEGNRIWDYSILYGRDRYNYPADQEIFAFIDRGRQSLWGLPFLIPGVSLKAVRLWSAFLVTVPYALLGWLAFRPLRAAREQWLLAGLWSLIFLNQGPIYTPLIFSAILVVAARRRPIWLALPLVFLAGHYAGISRFSWRFAPAIWAVLFTFGDAVLDKGGLLWRDWMRAVALFVAGIWTKGLPIIIGIVEGLLPADGGTAAVSTPVAGAPGVASVETLEGLRAATTGQPYLWYRLLPNDAFSPGILLGLALAVLPLVLLLFYALRKGIWKTTFWLKLVIAGSLLAFLAVGLIASVKVGGGTDLHNLDMFLITLVLLAALAWEAGLHRQLPNLLVSSPYVRGLLLAMLLIPPITPIIAGQPLDIPDEAQTQLELQRIRDRIACAIPHGEILLMDQRQLLTFGLLGDLPLVPDYEKKYVMDQALSANEAYFEDFRADLAAGRFSLILTERQSQRFKVLDEDHMGDSLVEENNAWVQWVTIPLLEYYESVANRRDAAIEMFIPIERDFDC